MELFNILKTLIYSHLQNIAIILQRINLFIGFKKYIFNVYADFFLSLAIHYCSLIFLFNAIAPKGGATAPWPLWTNLEGKTKKRDDVDGNYLLLDSFISFGLLWSPNFLKHELQQKSWFRALYLPL